MARLAMRFEEGGMGMYWVMGCSVAVVAITLAKLLQLYGPRAGSPAVASALERALVSGDVSGAVAVLLRTPGEVSRIALSGLRECLHEDHRIAAAVAAQLVIERAPLHRGLPLLQRCGQLATLFGLLGAILGLQTGFGGHSADASSRATALAAGISESMNCTAFGLLVATCALTSWWILDTRARLLDAELEHAAHTTCTLLTRHRAALRWLGARSTIVPGGYRTAD